MGGPRIKKNRYSRAVLVQYAITPRINIFSLIVARRMSTRRWLVMIAIRREGQVVAGQQRRICEIRVSEGT